MHYFLSMRRSWPLSKFLRQEIANNPGLSAISYLRNSYIGLNGIYSILRGGFQDGTELPLHLGGLA
jgi:hypothetical protein